MPLSMLTGGARSGKSDLAVRAACESGLPVTFIATAEAGDDEFAERIERHRRARPTHWRVIEEPLALGQAIARVPTREFLIVDCLSLWVANLIERGDCEDEVIDAARGAAMTAASRPASTVAVTNEVGFGIVPDNALARRYRDALGRVNRAFAEASSAAWLVVSGRVLALSEWSGT